MSWLSSNALDVGIRERKLITLSGIAPDIDGIGLVLDAIARYFGFTTNYWGQYHRSLHSLSFCLLVAIICYFAARESKFKVAIASFAVFHLHLICDVIGSKGPDGYQWPLPYLTPFSGEVLITWPHQWELNAWPNILIGASLVVATFVFARKYRRAPFELISTKADEAFLRIVDRMV